MPKKGKLTAHGNGDAGHCSSCGSSENKTTDLLHTDVILLSLICYKETDVKVLRGERGRRNPV